MGNPVQEGTTLVAAGRACCRRLGDHPVLEDHHGPIALVVVGHRRSCLVEDIVVGHRRPAGSGFVVARVALLVPAMTWSVVCVFYKFQ